MPRPPSAYSVSTEAGSRGSVPAAVGTCTGRTESGGTAYVLTSSSPTDACAASSWTRSRVVATVSKETAL